MQTISIATPVPVPEEQIKRASLAATVSLLNMTFLPVIGFLWLLYLHTNTEKNTIAYYFVVLGIKINIIAAVALGAVTLLAILMGGMDSPWTWVFVITYFTFVHAMFILFAVWTLIRSWTGQKLRKQKPEY